MRIMKQESYNAGKNPILRVGVIFLGIGLLFLIIAIGLAISSNNMKKKIAQNGIQVDAEITDIQKYRRSGSRRRANRSSRTEYDVYVKYVYNGETYENELSWYTSSMSVGDVLQITIDKNNPEKILNNLVGLILAIVFGIIGGVFFLVGVVIAWFRSRNY